MNRRTLIETVINLTKDPKFVRLDLEIDEIELSICRDEKLPNDWIFLLTLSDSNPRKRIGLKGRDLKVVVRTVIDCLYDQKLLER